MRFLVVAAAMSLGVGAAAQEDFVFSGPQVQQCFDGVSRAGQSPDCIGTAASTCMEQSPGGYSTVGMGYCLSLELDWWDGALNREYQRVMAISKQRDVDGGAPSVAEAMRAMQRAWITFRDRTCEYEASLWSNGTGAQPAYTGCLMRQTAMQALYLAGEGLDF